MRTRHLHRGGDGGDDEEQDKDKDKDAAGSKECRRNSQSPIRRNSMFANYANTFRIVTAKWIGACRQLCDKELNEQSEDLILPSNEHWRHRVYYRLVELQREFHDTELATKRAGEANPDARGRECKVEEWEAKFDGRMAKAKAKAKAKGRRSREEESSTSVRGTTVSMTEACVQPGWRVNDILLTAKVLRRVSPPPSYSDDAEMRRVFGLVYDVLRYKEVFSRALDDVGFWYRNGAIKDRERIVWLLLYDMQGRKFTRRGEAAAVEERERMFQAAGLLDIENALLEAKTHLAASISRLRISGSALHLDELLPPRLRIIGGVAWGEEAALASGWVNTKKLATKEQFLQEMSKLKLVFRELKQVGNGSDEDVTELEETGYAFDPICPKMVNLHESARERLAVSNLVRDRSFVFLERSLCLGAATLARVIRVGRFCGPIVLTHCLAPRHTGYLAGLLDDIENAGRLLAFGAGDRRCEYETYLEELGVTLQRCRVFSENYVSPPVTAELDRATVVLAVPPCSYTGVRDIVDLAVARGGDADLLETVTNAYATDDDRLIEPRALLHDQLSTLKYALTRPNVQLLIYEAHTILPSETTEMIRQVIDYANRMALEKYIREHSLVRPGSFVSSRFYAPVYSTVLLSSHSATLLALSVEEKSSEGFVEIGTVVRGGSTSEHSRKRYHSRQRPFRDGERRRYLWRKRYLRVGSRMLSRGGETKGNDAVRLAVYDQGGRIEGTVRRFERTERSETRAAGSVRSTISRILANQSSNESIFEASETLQDRDRSTNGTYVLLAVPKEPEGKSTMSPTYAV